MSRVQIKSYQCLAISKNLKFETQNPTPLLDTDFHR